MTWSSFAWDLPRNLTIKCSLFCTKFILKNLYLAEISLYKKPLFLRETARGPVIVISMNQYFLPINTVSIHKKYRYVNIGNDFNVDRRKKKKKRKKK